MAADEQVAQVLRAMEILEGRVRAAIRTEIAHLVPFGPTELDHALCRAVVGGWVERLVVGDAAERAGVRPGTTIYRLTAMADHHLAATEASRASAPAAALAS